MNFRGTEFILRLSFWAKFVIIFIDLRFMKLKRLLPEHTGWELRGKHHPILNFFKNFFIPHAGNRYEPHFLRPKRLFWYGLTSLSLKLVVVVFVSFLPLYAWMTPDIMAEEAGKIVSLTNDLRLNAGLAALIPNARLAEAAKGKTGDMLSGQYFAHTNASGFSMKYWLKSVGYNYLVAGENLAVGFGDAAATINAWKASPSHYQNLTGDFSETGVAVIIGDYKGKEVALAAQYVALPVTIAQRNSDISVAQAPIVNAADIGKEEKAALVGIASVSDKALTPSEVVGAAAVLSEETNKNSAELLVATNASGQNGVDVVKRAGDKKVSSTIVADAPKEVKVPMGVGSSTVSTTQLNINKEAAPLEPVVLQPSAWERYFLVKAHAVPATRWLFGFSSKFYKLLLLFVSFALILNIAIRFRVQNYRLIASGFAFIAVLSVLIII